MRSRPSLLRVGAIAFAVLLTGSYVWFRIAQAREQATATARKTMPTTTVLPGSKSSGMLPGSKFSPVYTDPYPDANATPEGLKLNDSISAEFAVGADTKYGIIDVVPNEKPQRAAAPVPTTRTAPNTFIYGSKSAPVDLIPRATTTSTKTK